MRTIDHRPTHAQMRFLTSLAQFEMVYSEFWAEILFKSYR